MPLHEDELRRLAERMRDRLRREIDSHHVDIADLMPYLREAAGDAELRSAFQREAARKGDVGQLLWAILTPEGRYIAFTNQCRRSAQLEDELRKCRGVPS